MQFQVFKIHSDFYYVKDSNNVEYTCKLRDVLKKQKIEIVVGDYVELSEDKNFIVALLKRNNFLKRPKTSNIDLALVVVSFEEPKLDFNQLDRYLIYLKYHKINTAICFNKEDLESDIDSFAPKIKSIYEKLGYKLFFVSAKNNIGLEDLKECIKNKNIVLTGSSGVGKSTLINALAPEFYAKTGNVSLKTLRGCHTTRHSEIIQCENCRITDTPGFSCLKFDFILPYDLLDLFDDLKPYKNICKYKDCLHNTKENGICGIVDNIDKIDKTRYKSYLLFLEEALEYKKKISKRSIKEESSNKNVGNRIASKISKRKRTGARNTVNQSIGEEDDR